MATSTKMAQFWAQNEKKMLTTLSSSSSVVTLILFGMLFAWLLATALMTYRAGVNRPRMFSEAAERSQVARLAAAPQRFAEAPPEQTALSATATAAVPDEPFILPMDESAPFPLTRGRRADQHVGPETASIAASFDSR
jgi:hypothetical protein